LVLRTGPLLSTNLILARSSVDHLCRTIFPSGRAPPGIFGSVDFEGFTTAFSEVFIPEGLRDFRSSTKFRSLPHRESAEFALDEPTRKKVERKKGIRKPDALLYASIVALLTDLSNLKNFPVEFTRLDVAKSIVCNAEPKESPGNSFKF
jgi:hypothetical protein